MLPINNKRDNHCFSRKHNKSIKSKARLSPDKVETEINKIIGLYQNVANHLEYLIHEESHDFVKKLAKSKDPSIYISSEDLFQFETDFTEESLTTSVNSWMDALDGWAFPGNPDKIKQAILNSNFQGVRPIKPHSDTISNSEEVHAILKTTKFSHYFRQ